MSNLKIEEDICDKPCTFCDNQAIESTAVQRSDERGVVVYFCDDCMYELGICALDKLSRRNKKLREEWVNDRAKTRED
jgi:hypothetical protein